VVIGPGPLWVPATGLRIPRLMASLALTSVTSPTERRQQLKAVYEQAKGCTRCPLHQTRTTVVFGSGNADADLMFVGEAPGANEDKQGLPFVGQAGKLLTKLLNEIGLDRGEVFICNTVKCRPPNNRDPHPNEIESCNEYLRRQVELIQPTVICTLGNFSTKLLRGDNTGISRLHGRAEVRAIGARAIRLYPLYHPAAALYTPSNLEVLRADFQRIPELLALGAPEQPAVEDDAVPEVPESPEPPAVEDDAVPEPPGPPADAPATADADPHEQESGVDGERELETAQLGLF
jgi:uracil-DNA glycosylase